MNNPRFPHTVVVYRETMDLTQESQIPVRTVLLSGECRNMLEGTSAYKKSAVNSDYIISLPLHNVPILAGDKVEVTDKVRVIHGEVIDAIVGNLGANIWYNEVKQ